MYCNIKFLGISETSPPSSQVAAMSAMQHETSLKHLKHFLVISLKESVKNKFQGVSKKFHVAWHSSQLPEQKEGLFLLSYLLNLYDIKYWLSPPRPCGRSQGGSAAPSYLCQATILDSEILQSGIRMYSRLTLVLDI